MNKKINLSLEENIIENGESISYKDFDQSRSIFDVFKNKKDNQYLEISDEIRIKNLKEFIIKKVHKVINLNIICDKILSNKEEKLLQKNHPSIYLGYSRSWNQDFSYLILLTNKGIKIPIALGGFQLNLTFGSGKLDQYMVGGEMGSGSQSNLYLIKDFIEESLNDYKINQKIETKEVKLSDFF